jgi:hypothetical protein
LVFIPSTSFSLSDYQCFKWNLYAPRTCATSTGEEALDWYFGLVAHPLSIIHRLPNTIMSIKK